MMKTMKNTSSNIQIVKGSLFDSDCQALVNTVNCVGVMGAGLAKQFKDRYPTYFDDYVYKCRRGYIQTGYVDIFRSLVKRYPPIIISFPTKRHWKESSKIDYIDSGLAHLKTTLETLQNNEGFEDLSVAIPPLGCGLGGLRWSEVKDLIYCHLEGSGFIVNVYET